MYSVAAAAAMSETTVLRAIQAGHISGTKNEINEWQVDPAEFHRLYAPGVTRSLSGNAPPADGTPARRSGQAEAICSRARLNDMAQASACPVWLTPTRKRSRLRGHVGGGW